MGHMFMIFFNTHFKPWIALAKRLDCLAVALLMLWMTPALVAADITDDTGIKRAFLDRYLDCAEAPDAAARLSCYDALLVDIPAWLEDPADPRAKPSVTEVGHDDPQIMPAKKRCKTKPSD
jgi:hypothetical protein